MQWQYTPPSKLFLQATTQDWSVKWITCHMCGSHGLSLKEGEDKKAYRRVSLKKELTRCWSPKYPNRNWAPWGQIFVSYFFWDTLTIFGVPLTTAFVWQVWQLRSRLEVALFPWLCSQSQAAGAGSAQVGTTQTILFRINLDLQSKPAGAHDHNLGLDRMWPKMKNFFLCTPTYLVRHRWRKTKSDPACNDGFVNGRIYERSNFGRCSLLINGSPQWENKCRSGKWLRPDRIMEG